MAMNPMQRKANNSFLLGVLITLLITGIIIVFLIYQVMSLNNTLDEQDALLTTVYVLTENVEAGEQITTDMLTTMQVWSTTVPSNALGSPETLSSYYLADELGNEALRGYELTDTNNLLGDNVVLNSDGKIIYSVSEYNELLETYEDAETTFSAESISYIPRQITVGGNTETVYCKINYDEDLDSYYILIPETTDSSLTRSTTYTYTKEVLESEPLIAKITMYANTVLTAEMVTEGQPVANDVRKQEYNVITLPTQLETGDYVDIRLRLPDGQDLIVVSYKEVEIPEIDGVPSEDCIWLELSEDEILTLSCAIVETYQMQGAKLYATTYVDPGMQEAAEVTYVPSDTTTALIRNDPNIVETAKAEIINRYNADISSDNSDRAVRQSIDAATTYDDEDEAAELVEEYTQDEISNLQDAREDYIDSLV